MWMALAEAVKRAGSLEALLPHLHEGRILSRHKGLYAWPGGRALTGPGEIPPGLWAKASVDPATGRIIFLTILSPRGWDDEPVVAYKVFAIGIDLECEPVEALWPKGKARRPRRNAGAKQSAAWDPLLLHLDAMVESGKIANPAEEAFSEAKNWLETNERLLTDDALRKGIKRNRPKWFEA